MISEVELLGATLIGPNTSPGASLEVRLVAAFIETSVTDAVSVLLAASLGVPLVSLLGRVSVQVYASSCHRDVLLRSWRLGFGGVPQDPSRRSLLYSLARPHF